jgi:hypothetical protein
MTRTDWLKSLRPGSGAFVIFGEGRYRGLVITANDTHLSVRWKVGNRDYDAEVIRWRGEDTAGRVHIEPSQPEPSL